MNQMKRDVILKPNRMFYPEKNYSHQELVLHATLLSRIFFNNNYSRKRSKQKDLKLFNLASNEELKEYIIHFFEDSFDPEEKGHKDAEDWESIPGTRYDIPDTRHEYTSCTAGDYGPGNPWDAPGMSIRDFIQECSKMEKFYEPTSYYAFHPVYSGAKHYMVFVSHYSMENGEMQICTYSEKKYSIDSCIQWAYL